MARKLTISFLLAVALMPTAIFAQLQLLQNSHDYGTLTRADERFVDFSILNSGAKPEVIFRVECPREVEVIMSAKTIAPGATETIRLHYNPAVEGPFDLKASVYASAWAEPHTIRLRGLATFAQGNIPCPDFSAAPAGSLREFHISLRSADTEPIEGAQVKIYRNGKPLTQLWSDENGELSTALLPGRYFISASWRGAEVDTAVYTSGTKGHVLLVFNTTGRVTPPAELLKVEPDTLSRNPSTQKPKKERPTRIPDSLSTPQPVSRPVVLEGDNELMPYSKFKQNNVVFLVDVSTSMKQKGKLDLLKIAMTDLLQVLRGADRLTLVSYATNTTVHLEAGAQLDVAKVAEAIMALEAGGSTEGARAIDKAGRTVQKLFLPEGNNQIILATDGAFNEGAKQAVKFVNKYRRRGIHTSVLCIRCGSFATKEMAELAKEGQGRFVPIESASDAGQRLIDEIKTSALR
jgi:Ca-activated chloride channel family protein